MVAFEVDADLRGARLWVSTLHPTEQYDECQWRELGRTSGADSKFRLLEDIAGRAVTMIRFQADLTGADRELRLTLVPAGEQP